MGYEEIKSAVEEHGGVTTLSMADLRDAEGAGRLTRGINERISKALERRGLGHVPYKAEDLSTSQWDEVRIFDRTSPIGKVIEAAHQVGEDFDKELREAVAGEASDMLDQIRAILSDQ
jgi:hypothetical protein